MLTTRQASEFLATRGTKKPADQIAMLASSGMFQGARKDEQGRWLIPKEELTSYLDLQQRKGKQRRRWLEIAAVLATLVGVLAVVSVTKDALDLLYTYILPRSMPTSSSPSTRITPVSAADAGPTATEIAALHVTTPDQPVFPLLVGNMTGQCNDFLIYEAGKVNQAFFQEGKDREVPQLPWLPALFIFYLQANTGQGSDPIVITSVDVEQRGQPREVDLATFESLSICASSGYEVHKSGYQSLGMLSLQGQRRQYSVTDLSNSKEPLLVASSGLAPFGIYLSGIDPGLYNLRLNIHYQFKDSGPLTAVSDWFSALAVSDAMIKTVYRADLSIDADAEYPITITQSSGLGGISVRSTSQAWFSDLLIENLVKQVGGEYIVLRNHSTSIIDPFYADRAGMAPHYGYSLATCDDVEIAALRNISATLPISPGSVGRIGVGDSSNFPPDTIRLSLEQADFGPCFMLEVDQAPVSQFPAR